jgi:hypothetical protein
MKHLELLWLLLVVPWAILMVAIAMLIDLLPPWSSESWSSESVQDGDP